MYFSLFFLLQYIYVCIEENVLNNLSYYVCIEENDLNNLSYYNFSLLLSNGLVPPLLIHQL